MVTNLLGSASGLGTWFSPDINDLHGVISHFELSVFPDDVVLFKEICSQVATAISRSLQIFAILLFMAKIPAGTGMSNVFQLKKKLT